MNHEESAGVPVAVPPSSLHSHPFTKRWIVRAQDNQRAAMLARVLDIAPVVASLLISRGCDDERSARAFLQPSYDQLHDPYLMLGMREAVSRLLRAIDLSEPILIYGDYDVDGTTGTAVLLRALESVLNPNQRGCTYPDKNLAGVGVAFKLVHALFRERGRESQVAAFLKVVAIGTVADVAKLVGENRTIVTLGLKDLANARNPGLRALMEVSGCGDGSGMKAYDLGFRVGPRINAAGRMDAARAVVELFETKDREEAQRLAEHLDRRNQERKQVQAEIIARAIAELETFNSVGEHSHVAVIAGQGWHRGVIGIAASKIAEKINRPCVVISIEGEIGHGSARSIEAYHLLNGLTDCSDLFEKFGGHSHAAGITIKADRIEEFRRRLNAHAAARLTDEDLQPRIFIDAELPAESITFEFANQLRALEPFGAGNPRPVFLTRNLRVMSEPLVMKEQHLKLRLAGSGGRPLETVWWHGVESMEQTPGMNTGIEMAYTIETNSWNNEVRLQLCVEDLRQVASA